MQVKWQQVRLCKYQGHGMGAPNLSTGSCLMFDNLMNLFYHCRLVIAALALLFDYCCCTVLPVLFCHCCHSFNIAVWSLLFCHFAIAVLTLPFGYCSLPLSFLFGDFAVMLFWFICGAIAVAV